MEILLFLTYNSIIYVMDTRFNISRKITIFYIIFHIVNILIQKSIVIKKVYFEVLFEGYFYQRCHWVIINMRILVIPKIYILSKTRYWEIFLSL